MSMLTNGFVALPNAEALLRQVAPIAPADRRGQDGLASTSKGADQDAMRRYAWQISEARPADHFSPPAGHVALAPVAPCEGFAHWRILEEWVDRAARQKGNAWRNCRLVLRLYDVSCIDFNGLNAHRILDRDLPGLCGQFFFKLPKPGTWELAEVGFLLQTGEFLPAARSRAVPFPANAPSSHAGQAALLVNDQRRVEEVGNLWDQEKILRERKKPQLRRSLRCAAFAFAARDVGHEGWLATFVSELATGQCNLGHEPHVFLPANDQFNAYRQVAGVHYHPLEIDQGGTPFEQAQAFASAAESRLRELPPFHLIHQHEWMTGWGQWSDNLPTILSLGSIEATRRNGSPPSELSLEIEHAERQAARAAATVLTPHWLREQALAELGVDANRLHGFPMEGRLPNEWEAPLDSGQVKMGIGLGPLDRLILFAGPLEHASGVDLLLEALPVLLQRAPNLRIAFVGAGIMYGQLQHRAHQLGIHHAVRILGHVEGSQVTRLMRAAEALVLPSRYRVPFDDGVVDLARRAGRPVVTTHGGPAHLVRHEETGIVTYDNPGSIVWAIDRILGDSSHAERMGNNGRRRDQDSGVMWSDVARHYLELCAAQFPELTEMTW
jgi:glycosyltransferase involved in cell wall biosynthesis